MDEKFVKLMDFIHNSNDWLTLDELLEVTDYSKEILKRKLEVLKDNFVIIQAGSRYLKYSLMSKV